MSIGHAIPHQPAGVEGDAPAVGRRRHFRLLVARNGWQVHVPLRCQDLQSKREVLDGKKNAVPRDEVVAGGGDYYGDAGNQGSDVTPGTVTVSRQFCDDLLPSLQKPLERREQVSKGVGIQALNLLVKPTFHFASGDGVER